MLAFSVSVAVSIAFALGQQIGSGEEEEAAGKQQRSYGEFIFHGFKFSEPAFLVLKITSIVPLFSGIKNAILFAFKSIAFFYDPYAGSL
jgi:hypothetical protein